jgi:hypothetical protein
MLSITSRDGSQVPITECTFGAEVLDRRGNLRKVDELREGLLAPSVVQIRLMGGKTLNSPSTLQWWTAEHVDAVPASELGTGSHLVTPRRFGAVQDGNDHWFGRFLGYYVGAGVIEDRSIVIHLPVAAISDAILVCGELSLPFEIKSGSAGSSVLRASCSSSKGAKVMMSVLSHAHKDDDLVRKHLSRSVLKWPVDRHIAFSEALLQVASSSREGGNTIRVQNSVASQVQLILASAAIGSVATHPDLLSVDESLCLDNVFDSDMRTPVESVRMIGGEMRYDALALSEGDSYLTENYAVRSETT